MRDQDRLGILVVVLIAGRIKKGLQVGQIVLCRLRFAPGAPHRHLFSVLVRSCLLVRFLHILDESLQVLNVDFLDEYGGTPEIVG